MSNDNFIMIQFFEWFLPADGKHWERLVQETPLLKELGVSGVWLPPCYKAMSGEDVGYAVYDFYDLGEFKQKGSVRTKYGTRAELEQAITVLHQAGLQVYADVVVNHKAGADETERFKVVKVDPDNRTRIISKPYEIEGWTKFVFPGRKGKYSKFQYYFNHFTATDFDQATGEKGIYRILGEGKTFNEQVDLEFGNYDYLMFADLDYEHPDVIESTVEWGKWFAQTLKLDGFRLDAVKHINAGFIEHFVREVRSHIKRDFFAVGEYWTADADVLRSYLEDVEHQLTLFDVTLHFNFHDASLKNNEYDLRQIFAGTLVESNPWNTVTFVDNHDSQRGQSLQSWVEDWFKPLAYAFILLRRDGYPCLFYGDYYGTGKPDSLPGHRAVLDVLLRARRELAYGDQIDTFDHANVVAWQRLGDEDHPGSGLAVVVSNGDDGDKLLNFGPERAGSVWHDLTGQREEIVTLDESGSGTFFVTGRSVSVWAADNS